MTWSKRSSLGIYDKNGHLNFLSDSGNPGDVCLDKVIEWFDVTSTGLTLVDLFNLLP